MTIKDHKEINRFGNFAMIGADANSSGSNWDPISKINQYLRDSKINQVSVASLKFRIMLQICHDNNGHEGAEWDIEDIARHERDMIKLIMTHNNSE